MRHSDRCLLKDVTRWHYTQKMQQMKRGKREREREKERYTEEEGRKERDTANVCICERCKRHICSKGSRQGRTTVMNASGLIPMQAYCTKAKGR